MKRRLFYALLAALMLVQASQTNAQSGGSFEIKQSVIANGGGTVSSGAFSIESTIGQPVAGTLMFGGNFSIHNGYGQPFENQCLYSLSGTSVAAAGVGGNTAPIQVNTTQGCAWTAVSNANWIGINSGAIGSGSGAVILSVAGNGGAPRSGTVTIAGLTFTVYQDGANSAFFTVSGSVIYASTPVNQSVKFVPNVSLTVANSAMSATSNSSGNYALSNLAGGAQYSISAVKNGDVNGINSLDATRIQQHLVGLITLTPSQLAAADVNNSGNVNSLDATRIQQYLVGIPATHNIGQWKFLPSTRQYNSISGNVGGENYEAVLLGEVSGNWTTSQGFAAETESEAESEEGVIKGESNELKEKTKTRQRNLQAGSSELPASSISSDQKTDSKSAANVSLPNLSAAVGALIEIPVTINRNGDGNTEAFDFSVFYDPAILQPAAPLGGKTGTLSNDCAILANSPVSGSIKVSAACAEPIVKEQGTLFVLRFNVLAAGGQTFVSFRDPMTNQNTFFFNENAAPAKLTDGTVTISAASTGGTISGRVVSAGNRPVYKAQVTLTDGSGNVRYAVTNQNGSYRFVDVAGEQDYVISVVHKQHRFDSRTVSRENLSEINFTAAESTSETNP